jgi:hypothetical protein
MSILGKYCRAYQLRRLRQFPGWTEKPENARIQRREVNGEVVEEARKLTDADYVYLQRNYTVTDSIFIDENIIFNDVTREWIEYCNNELGWSHEIDASENDSL